MMKWARGREWARGRGAGPEWVGLKLLVAAALVGAACLMAAGCGDALSTTEQARDDAQQEASAAIDATSPAASSADVTALPAPTEGEVAVVLDASNAAAANDKFPASLGAFVVPSEPGDTVLGALEKTGVDLDVRANGYVSSIGGVAERACGPSSGWLYLVDGVQPMVAASAYELKGGETMRWAYTVEEGDVEGAGMGGGKSSDASR